MFTRWLLNTLPAELAAAWRLVRADLSLWLALALVPALITVAAGGGGAAPAPAVAVTIVLTLVLFSMLAIAKFDAARHERRVALGDTLPLIARRLVPYVAAFATVYSLTLGAGWLAERAVLTVTADTPVGPLAAMAVSTVIYITLLARYAFWPYLAVLERGSDLALDRIATRPWMLPIARFAWPLMASTRLTEGMIWSVVPYVILLGIGPPLTATAPESLRAPLAAVWWIAQLVLQAALFNHYADRRPLLDAEKPRP